MTNLDMLAIYMNICQGTIFVSIFNLFLETGTIWKKKKKEMNIYLTERESSWVKEEQEVNKISFLIAWPDIRIKLYKRYCADTLWNMKFKASKE